MVARTWVPLVALLALAAALAGCTSPSTDAATPPPAGGNDQPPAGNGNLPPSSPPSDFELAEDGQIQGTFEKAWDIEVENVAFGDAHLLFSLAELEPGVPATARIHLALYDPNDIPLRITTIGLGAPTSEADWMFTPGQLPVAGTYHLRASVASDNPLPSGGFAAYHLDAHVSY